MLVVGIQAGTGTANAAVGASAAPAASAQRAAAVELARTQAPALARTLALGSQEKLVVKDVVVDADGTRHVRYDRTYGGLPVLGGDLVVHQAAGGAVKSVDRAVPKRIALKSLTPALAPAKAAGKASSAVRSLVGDTSDKDASPLRSVGAAAAPKLVVWAASGTPRLAYETVVTGTRADGTPSEQHVVTDAASGAVLSRHEAVQTVAGSGRGVFVGSVPLETTLASGTYQLKDAARGGQYTTNLANRTNGAGTLYTDADNAWGDGTVSNGQSAAVDAQFGAAATWDYYKNTFGRNGIANDGKGAYSRVHYGRNYVNAFWSDSCFCMTYGDGSGNTHPLTELDVSGHEMSHGVTSRTANLAYSGESGGLNEATSDIFGTMVEFSANLTTDKPDYLIGELIDLNGNGTPLRYMDKPSRDGASADYWSSGVGSLDVHYSSGVANHFFYLLSEGSGAKTVNGVGYNSPTYNGATLAGIGRDKAAAIWYRALTVYMTSTTNYKAARTATLNAAKDLYGSGSAEYNAVAATWTAVNVN
ncbi:M4 family metallopeptidase [Streptomyces sp. NPDC001380]|uniref:M4 family metallopeptidase n=1 Tax=Streptomyces sp. NPDC001380 TaxID=3364566 RepID=UPI0036C42B45